MTDLDLLTYAILAVGLAMDATAVSIARGALLRCRVIHHAFLLACAFGAFQAIMPVFGWIGGRGLADIVTSYGSLLAAVILLIIGAKMIIDAGRPEKECPQADSIPWTEILLLAIATSIDAFAIGVSFAFLEVSLLIAVLIIGAVTFLFSFTGVLVGERFGHLFEKRIEILGGIILMGIGVKILAESMLFG